MRKLRLHLRMVMQITIACISIGSLSGCVESNFQLASESRLPKCMALPPGIKRENVSVEMRLYTTWHRPSAKFLLRDQNGKTLKRSGGKAFYTNNYEIITVDGITEIVETKPGRYVDHHLLAPHFSFIDDPARRNEILESLPKSSKQ